MNNTRNKEATAHGKQGGLKTEHIGCQLGGTGTHTLQVVLAGGNVETLATNLYLVSIPQGRLKSGQKLTSKNLIVNTEIIHCRLIQLYSTSQMYN